VQIKKGDPTLFRNYRPISILLACSFLKKIVYGRLTKYTDQHTMLWNCQFGFKKYSPYMALWILTDKMTNAIDKGEHILGLF